MSARATSSWETASAPQPKRALRFRNWRREVPFCSAIDHLQLFVRDVVDARRRALVRLQDLDPARLLHLRDEALGIALVAEVADASDAARDALSEHAARHAVQAGGPLRRAPTRDSRSPS